MAFHGFQIEANVDVWPHVLQRTEKKFCLSDVQQQVADASYLELVYMIVWFDALWKHMHAYIIYTYTKKIYMSIWYSN